MQYPARESKALEFKSTVKKFDAIVRTAIAFANGVGGKIIIGIDSEVNQECYMPTVAGTLLFSENPERAIPEALVICTRFSGVSGRNIIQTEEIKGPLSKQIAVSFELVSSWLKRHYQLQGIHMTARSLVPGVALREAIINAVAHRKYTIPGATKIALYEDRLEIFSPGNFPGHVNIDNLGEGITHLRNPVLGRMLHRMGMIEKLGSGIRAMFDSCRAAKLALPTFSEDGDYVKVNFRFQPLAEKAQTDADKLIALLKIRETVTVADIVDYLGRSRNTVLSLLHQLMLEEKVQRLGKGRATRYSLK